MELAPFFKSIIDQDRTSIVICDLEHTIIYMNPAAIANYEKCGGEALVGSSLLDCHNAQSCEKIEQVLAWFAKSSDNNIIYESHNSVKNKDVYIVALRDESKNLIGYYEKHEFRAPETASFYDMR